LCQWKEINLPNNPENNVFQTLGWETDKKSSKDTPLMYWHSNKPNVSLRQSATHDIFNKIQCKYGKLFRASFANILHVDTI